MAEMEEVLNPKGVEVHDDFRLWITCEPHPEFPLSLLQMAIKVTNEPPKGLRAGLFRTFTTLVNPDYLEKVEPPDRWRSLLFTTCFLHSIVQERRKFGPLGFCVPYEFNNSDLEASLGYIDRHLTNCSSMNIQINWEAIKYMVCEVQYGGRITDNLDREMFNTYGKTWYHEGIFTAQYPFNPRFQGFRYDIPDTQEHSQFMKAINDMPSIDSPQIFGLHPNADLTFRLKESLEMINILVDTQPKDAAAAGGKSPEEEVRERIEKEFLDDLPADFDAAEFKDKIKDMRGPKGSSDKGLNVPLNVFLYQELTRFQFILTTVRRMMRDIIDAIDGTIIMTPDLVNAIGAIYDLRVPYQW